eukprot:gene22885-30060_t
MQASMQASRPMLLGSTSSAARLQSPSLIASPRVRINKLGICRTNAEAAQPEEALPKVTPVVVGSGPFESAQANAMSVLQSPESPINQYFGTEELIEELADPGGGNPVNALLLVEFAALFLIVFQPIALKGLIHLIGILLLSAGIVTIIYSFICLGKNFSPLPTPRKMHKLVTSGMYSIVRHPMFAGVLMLCFGFTAITMSEARLALTLLLWFVLEKKVQFEEAALTKHYPEYATYASGVNKFIPFVY